MAGQIGCVAARQMSMEASKEYDVHVRRSSGGGTFNRLLTWQSSTEASKGYDMHVRGGWCGGTCGRTAVRQMSMDASKVYDMQTTVDPTSTEVYLQRDGKSNSANMPNAACTVTHKRLLSLGRRAKEAYRLISMHSCLS